MQSIQLTSDAFRHGDPIPSRYTCDGENISPQLSWGTVPDGTKSIAIIVEDPDAPRGTFLHWILYNLPPATTKLPEHVPEDRRLPRGGEQGMNDMRTVGYFGPCPPPGRPHRFFFRLYALDTMLGTLSGGGSQAFHKAVEGHVLGEGELMGTYARR